MTALGTLFLVALACLILLFVEAAKGFLEGKDAQEKLWEKEQRYYEDEIERIRREDK